jgi:hypothetical protein
MTEANPAKSSDRKVPSYQNSNGFTEIPQVYWTNLIERHNPYIDEYGRGRESKEPNFIRLLHIAHELLSVRFSLEL